MLLSNADGTAVQRAGDVRDRLVRQLTCPVRCDLCQATLRDLGVTALIELPPAGTLAGIASRELPGVETVRLSTPDDLAAAQALVARTTAGSQGEHTPDWRVVIAPAARHVRRRRHRRGHPGAAGSRLGAVRSRARGARGQRHVRRGAGGVAAWRTGTWWTPASRSPGSCPAGPRSADRACQPAVAGARILSLRRLPTGERGDQRRPRRPDGHQRRVDPAAGSASPSAAGSPDGRDRRRTWPWRPAARRWRPAGCRRTRSTWSSSRPARLPTPIPGAAGQVATGSASPRPARSTSTPACAGFCYAPVGVGHRRDHAPATPATCSSSASSGSPT